MRNAAFGSVTLYRSRPWNTDRKTGSPCAFPELSHSTGYNRGCRCDGCRAAKNAIGQKSYRRQIGDPSRRAVLKKRHKTQSERFRAECRKFLNEYKLSKGCADCGYNAHPAALDCDHVRGEKVADVARLKVHRKEFLLAELEKCDVVCANCHRIRTARRKSMAKSKAHSN